jgi:hypothetical protein
VADAVAVEPVSVPYSRANREKYREFQQNPPIATWITAGSADNSTTFDEIPCRSQQGIFGEETGRIVFRTGNLFLIPAASSGPPLPCHFGQSLGVMLRSDCVSR